MAQGWQQAGRHPPADSKRYLDITSAVTQQVMLIPIRRSRVGYDALLAAAGEEDTIDKQPARLLSGFSESIPE